MAIFNFNLSGGNNQKQNKGSSIFDFSLSNTITPAQDQAQRDQAWAQAEQGYRSHKIVNGVDPALANVKEPSAISKLVDFAINRPSQAVLAAAIENAQNPNEGFMNQLVHGGQEFVQGLEGNRPNATGSTYLTAKGWGGDGIGKSIVGGALDILSNPVFPGIMKLGKGAVKGLPIVGELGKSLAATSAAGGIYGGLEGVANDGSAGDILKGVATGAMEWPLGELGIRGAGKILGNVAGEVGSRITKGLNKNEGNGLLNWRDAPTLGKGATRAEPVVQTINGLGKGAATPLPSTIGTKGKGIAREQGSGIMNESQFKTNTLTNSEFLRGSEIQKLVQDTEMMYEVKPNTQSVERATQMVQNDFQGTMDRIKSSESLSGAEDATAAGIITNALRKEAQALGDYTQLTEWLKVVQPKVTTTAQSLQALGTWKNMTVEGALTKASQVVGQANREMIASNKFKGRKPVELTPTDAKYITEQMTKVEQMPDATATEQRLKDIEFARVRTYIADKVPADVTQKIDAFRRIMMLLNPRTLISRNMGGNAILGAFENIKDIPGGLVDMATSSIAGTPRTTLMPSLGGLATQGKGMVKGAKEMAQDIKLGIDTSPSRGQYELPYGRTFDNPILNGLDKATIYGLQIGDRPFYQAALDEALRQQMKIHKVTVPTQGMKDIATKAAQDRTFQNDSEISQAIEYLRGGINKLGSGIGIGSEKWGLGNIIVPFAKTPGNIMDKAIDYSPVGFIRAAREVYRGSRGNFDQKKFVDSVGRAVTGTGLIMLGYDLAKSGVITGQGNKDYEVATLQRNMGQGPYSYNMSSATRLVNGANPKTQKGDVFRTYDFAQPVSVALAIGADIYSGVKDRKKAANIVVEGIKSGGNTLMKQSVLQGLQKVMGGYDVMQNLLDSILQMPLQFVPSAGNQAAKLMDPNARETYSPDMGTEITNMARAKIPGVSESLPAKVDTLGRPVSSVQGGNSIWNTTLNPGITKTYNPTPAEEMIMDIYDKTGEKVQFPRLVDKNIKGQPLSTEQYTKYQQMVGQRTLDIFNRLAADTRFRSTDPNQQAKTLQSALTELNQITKYELGIEVKKETQTKAYQTVHKER